MLRICVVYILLLGCGPVFAALEVGTGGGGSCFQLVSDLQRNWMEVKRHLVPVSSDLNRAEDDQFMCVSPYATRNALESRAGTSSAIRCFRSTTTRGLGFCCDTQLTSCAMLNPSLFPEHLERMQPKERAYEPPKSGWVRPPSDGDQWKSN